MSCLFPCCNQTPVYFDPNTQETIKGDTNGFSSAKCLKISLFVILALGVIATIPASFAASGLWSASAPAFMQMMGSGLTIYGVGALLAYSGASVLAALGYMLCSCYRCICCPKLVNVDPPLIVYQGIIPEMPEELKAFKPTEYPMTILKPLECVIWQQQGELWFVVNYQGRSIISENSRSGNLPSLPENATLKDAWEYHQKYLRHYRLVNLNSQ